MGVLPEDTVGRHVEWLLRRCGLSADVAPQLDEWAEFLEHARALVSSLDRDRYLSERSLELASEELRQSAAHLADEGEELRRTNSSLLATVEEQKRRQDELSYQAFHDPLTGLANRAQFGQRLDRALSAGTGEGSVGVVIADLDGFKFVNDNLGHLAGDALLVAVAGRLRAALREVDTVARFGGDEFGFIVTGLSSPEQAERVGRRILDCLTPPFQVGNRSVSVAASVGIAVSTDKGAAAPAGTGGTAPPGAGVSADRLLGEADAAMYQAKRDGKGCWRRFEGWMRAARLERLHLEQALRDAVGNWEITVAYQPVLAARTGRLARFEALARWDSGAVGSVPPEVFIPLAEETGLIHALGRQVLERACMQTARWRSEGDAGALGIAVNVSPLQLASPGFAGEVSRALSAADLGPGCLTLEVAESAMDEEQERLAEVLAELRAGGSRVAIDDFGTGHSSLAALAELPVDALKIDKSFVEGLTIDPGHWRLVRAITQLGRTLGLQTTAEGVETPEQQSILLAQGCDHLQGALYSRPLSPEDATAYLRTYSLASSVRTLEGA